MNSSSTDRPEAPQKPQPCALVAAAAIAACATYLGWRELWFLVDDAYIAFRYVSNSMLGRGLVWNPAPFAPVEGYTSFLWVVLLRFVWSLTGIEPPACANWLSLGFGYATLALGASMVLRMSLPERAARLRLVWLGLVLAWTITNRTFLTWLSSGLETSLFTFAITYWVWAATRTGTSAAVFVAHLAGASAVAALTRPDGLLFAAFAGLIALVRIAYEGKSVLTARLGYPTLPILCIPAHLLYRRLTYGFWVPNTYFAKYVAPWPESGARYFASFCVEYGVWLWLLIALLWIGVALRNARSWLPALRQSAAPITVMLVCGALLAHFSYYTWIIGGDHFEYRVYAHLVLLLGIALVWMLAQIADRPAVMIGVTVIVLAASWPVPWTHWQYGKHERVAKHMPRAVRPVIKRWDRWQHWLSERAVCDRHQEHTAFLKKVKRKYPKRAKGAQLEWSKRPVIARACVGYVAWSLPNVAVIDTLGLNDRVVARNPVKKGNQTMAHDRRPPKGYVECFRPNVRVAKQRARIRGRDEPLSRKQIKACDSLDRWLGSS